MNATDQLLAAIEPPPPPPSSEAPAVVLARDGALPPPAVASPKLPPPQKEEPNLRPTQQEDVVMEDTSAPRKELESTGDGVIPTADQTLVGSVRKPDQPSSPGLDDARRTAVPPTRTSPQPAERRAAELPSIPAILSAGPSSLPAATPASPRGTPPVVGGAQPTTASSIPVTNAALSTPSHLGHPGPAAQNMMAPSGGLPSLPGAARTTGSELPHQGRPMRTPPVQNGPQHQYAGPLHAVQNMANRGYPAQGPAYPQTKDLDNQPITLAISRHLLRKAQILQELSARDIDELAPMLLQKASNTFLDKAIALRLPTISARTLLNMLARAERLGYDASDIVEEAPEGPTPDPTPHVQHYPKPPAQAHVPTNYPPATPAKATQPTQPPQYKCASCGREFVSYSPYKHHSTKFVCTRPHPADQRYSCGYCGQWFTNQAGLSYHTSHNVCMDQPESTDAVRSNGGMPAGSPRTRSPGRPSPAQNPATPLPRPAVSTSLQATANNSIPAPSPNHVTTPLPAWAPAPPTPVQVAQSHNTPSRTSKTGLEDDDPYASLPIAAFQAMKSELLQAEAQYFQRVALAKVQPSNGESPEETFRKLKNCLATKLSNTRKKYGVRLRAGRSRAQSEWERLQQSEQRRAARVRSSPEGPPEKRRRVNGPESGGNATPTLPAAPAHLATPGQPAPLGANSAHATVHQRGPNPQQGPSVPTAPMARPDLGAPAAAAAAAAAMAATTAAASAAMAVMAGAKPKNIESLVPIPQVRGGVGRIPSDNETDSDSDSELNKPAMMPPPPPSSGMVRVD